MGYVHAALIAIIVAGGPSYGWAADNAIDLLRQCEGREPAAAPDIGVVACASYLSGFVDAQSMLVGIRGGLKAPIFCLPSQGVSNEELVRVYVKWSTDHPELLHESARVVVLIALRDAFPCQ